MSTSINVHTSQNTMEQRHENRLVIKTKTDTWPRNFKLEYKAGGPGIDGNHETCVFIGSLSAQAIRELAGDLDAASAKMFAYADWLDANGNDTMEG